MPKIYRGMKKENGKPALGNSATALGVRVPDDIRPDGDGRVHPETGGMSVSPSVAALPPHRIPQRLRERIPGARGGSSLFVWSMGVGPFAAGALAPRLQVRIDVKNENHGLVEPDAVMDLADYQNALYATRDAWSVDEE
jgi:hypothetical protein